MRWAYIAFELVSFVLFGGFLGWLADQVWALSGVGTAIGVALFFFLWSLYIWRKFRF